jgi:glutamate/tyrosine decarboxylase-like PLP-dependent enzyme
MRLENLFTHLKKELKARQEVTKEAICNNVKDWDTYRYLTGKLHGLREAEQELLDLLRKMERDDED